MCLCFTLGGGCCLGKFIYLDFLNDSEDAKQLESHASTAVNFEKHMFTLLKELLNPLCSLLRRIAV